MVNTSEQRLSQSRFEWFRQSGTQAINGLDRGFKQSSGELADTHHNGERTRPKETESQSKEIEGKKQRQERNEVQRQWVWSESGFISGMGNTNNARLQGRHSEKCGKCA